MRIAYILTNWPNPTETFAQREIEQLSRKGFDIRVLAAARAGESLEQCRSRPVQYRPLLWSKHSLTAILYLICNYPVGTCRLLFLTLCFMICSLKEMKSLLGNFHTIGRFTQYLDRENISHIHAYFLSWPACMALALALTTRRTYSISGHARDIYVEAKGLKLKAKKAQFITACTCQGLKYLKNILPKTYHGKLHLVYHGIDVESIYSSPSGPYNKKNTSDGILYAVGRLVAKKGFPCLLHSFARLRAEYPACKLLVFGEGPKRDSLEKISSQLKLNGNVSFLGGKKHSLLMRQLKLADILIVPSVIAPDGDRDGIPNVILEAFALGVPVIASDLESIREAIIPRKNGLLFEPGNVRQLTHNIKELLAHKTLQKRLSQKAYLMLKKKFDIKNNTGLLVDLFKKIPHVP